MLTYIRTHAQEYHFQAQTLALIIQEKVCMYGSLESDVDLTSNKKLKVTARNKREKFLRVIGDLVTEGEP